MGIFDKLKPTPTLAELQEKNEYLEEEVEIERKRAEIRKIKMAIDAKGGKGFSVKKAIEWLRNH
jgi:hypothetical protein